MNTSRKAGDLHGRTALVTGASSGLGAEFARQLAARGSKLVLVARRAEALESLAASLRQSGTEVVVQPADLSLAATRMQLAEDLRAAGVHIDLLVNNAGLGVYGPFIEAEWSRVAQMLEVDVAALTHLSHLFAPPMVQRGYGRILQIASTAAFQSTPGYAAYAAAKSYVLSFGLALNYELSGTGVSCTTLCPGVTATEFFDISGQQQTWFQRATRMDAPSVARCGIRALLAQRGSIVAGGMNALMAWSTRFTPRQMSTAVAHQLMKSP